MQHSSAKKLIRKPINTALGDLSNNTIGSTAGIEPGAMVFEMPLKAGTISSANSTTPF